MTRKTTTGQRDPAYAGTKDQVTAAARNLGEAGQPVDLMVRAAARLESFSRGEAGYGGLGEDGAPWLAQTASALLEAAGTLASELRPWPPAGTSPGGG
jgi:hypothetical protein